MAQEHHDDPTPEEQRPHAYLTAMRNHPSIRDGERRALTDLFELGANDRFCDVPSGTGYLADAIAAIGGPALQVVCIEPEEALKAEIPAAYHPIIAPLGSAPVTDESFTAIGSLSGLHHTEDMKPVFEDFHRLLEPAGQLGVADIAAGTSLSGFLESFAIPHSSLTRPWQFIEPHEFRNVMDETGFDVLTDTGCDVVWSFATREDAASFCRDYFYIDKADPADVADALESAAGLALNETTERWELTWELALAYGRKIG